MPLLTTPSEDRPPRDSSNFLIFALAALAVLACVWRFTPLHEKLSLAVLTRWGNVIRGHPWTPVAVPLVFVVAAVVGFSHAALVWATVFTFSVGQAFLYSEVGTLAGALTLYALGRVLRQDLVRRIAGSRLDQISRAAGRNGILTMIVLHIFPIAPNTVLNLAAGASHIGLTDFIVGTVLGATPGILVVCLFGHRLIETMHHPAPRNFFLLGLYLLIAWFTLRFFRGRLLEEPQNK